MRAACRDIENDVFFHPERERGLAKHVRDEHAKFICGRCPVIEACRRHALSVQEPYGVWGGLTVAERAAILRHPRRLTLSRPDHGHLDSSRREPGQRDRA